MSRTYIEKLESRRLLSAVFGTPVIADSGPLWDVAVDDFNNDGVDDLISLPTINPTQLNLEWESSTNSVLVHYTGSSNGALPDGHYRFTIHSTDVSDASGNTLGSDFTFNFNVYAGDINGDGAVNFNDLLIIAQNYGSHNATFDQGDLDYDGDVDFEDLLLVAQRYGTSLPQLRPVSDVKRTNLFSIR